MRRLLIVILVLAFAVIGAAFVIPMLIPSDVLRERVERAASDTLGREVTLAGDIGLRLLPTVQVSASPTRRDFPARRSPRCAKCDFRWLWRR